MPRAITLAGVVKPEPIAKTGHFRRWGQPEAFIERLTAFIDGDP